MISDWDRFVGGASQFIARDNWLWLIAIWILLKVWHELGHALACKQFGGNVRECGVSLILFVPLPYVDITSAWWIASKWRRILTSAAGMLFELPLAALAAIVWSQTEPGLLNQNALNVVYAAGFTTIVFNANPLMKFDGYYILSDLLELPNLAARGSQSVRGLCRRWFLGLPTPSPDYPEGRSWFVLLYGIAALLWRIMVGCGMILLADVMFYGAGMILAAAAVIAWGVIPVGMVLRQLIRGEGGKRPSRLRFAFVLAGTVVGGWTLLTLTPWSGRISAVGVVDYYPRRDSHVGRRIRGIDRGRERRVDRGGTADRASAKRGPGNRTQSTAVRCRQVGAAGSGVPGAEEDGRLAGRAGDAPRAPHA